MHVLVVFNPVSGAALRRGSQARIRAFLEKRQVTYEWFETVPADRQPLERLAGKDFDRVIVVGGDGTVRQVAQFLSEQKADMPLAVIPQGTGNILAASVGIPALTLERSLRFGLEAEPRPLDIMKINGKHIGMFAAGSGYDAVFLQFATRELKRQFGFFAYVMSFLRTFFGYGHHRFRITVDGETHEIAAKMVLVLNIMTLKGLELSHDLNPCDGVLNVAALSPRSLWDSLRIAVILLLRLPKHWEPKLKRFRGRHIVVEQEGGGCIQIDGEVLNETRLEVKVMPSALRVVYSRKFPS